eukprot:TRINITY_DN67806_c5_g1_i1.p1 TRINITY_DN67806_c5_g1~~TRINITY_DN67806_c5_g1_i1.p1  ORF type:complete len:391 (+),score=49.85 TRINITY_DN67806_c5_g1_i1:57-1229(+)
MEGRQEDDREFIKKKQIPKILDSLLSAMLKERPEDPEEFIQQFFRNKQSHNDKKTQCDTSATQTFNHQPLVALITGCSSPNGFGTTIVKALAAENSSNVIYATMRDTSDRNSNNKATLESLSNVDGRGTIKVLQVDVRNEPSIAEAVKLIQSERGHLDVLINNAGVGGIGVLQDWSEQKMQQVFDVNVWGAVRTTRLCIPLLRRSRAFRPPTSDASSTSNTNTPKQRERTAGLVISVSSVFGQVALPLWGVYSASKHALEAFAECWKYELEPLGIDSCTIVPPGCNATDFSKTVLENSPKPRSLKNYGTLRGIPELLEQQWAEGQQQPTSLAIPKLVADAVLRLLTTNPGCRPQHSVLTTEAAPELRNLKALHNMSVEMNCGLLQSIGLA